MKSNESKKPIKRYKVLIAVRDELFGSAILDFVRKHSWPEKTQFHLVYVIEPNPLKSSLIIPLEVAREIEKDEKASGKQVLDFMARSIYKSLPGARVMRHLRSGFPKHELIDLSGKLNADLVVLGSHTRKGLDRLILGSVANAVVANAACSSIVIRLSDEQLNKEIPLDFSLDDIPERMKEDVEIGITPRAQKETAAPGSRKKE